MNKQGEGKIDQMDYNGLLMEYLVLLAAVGQLKMELENGINNPI